jgi:phenylacetate-CoA ligase
MSFPRVPHKVLSKYVVWPLLDFQQFVRPNRRESVKTFWRGVDFRSKALGWSDSQKREWTLRHLRKQLRYAAAESPFYADWFKTVGFETGRDFDFSDFSRLPVLERDVVLNCADRMICKSVPREKLQCDSSGGSTGAPVRIWVGPVEKLWHSSAREFFMRRVGVPRGSRTAFLWGHYLDPVEQQTVQQKIDSFLNNRRWFDCFRLSANVLDRYHEELEAYRPDCIVAYASALGALATRLHQRGISANYPETCIITGAEKLYPEQRRVAELVFPKPIYERYGSRDSGLMGHQVPGRDDGSFEVDWANLLVEPQDSNRESGILITKLHADGMPMIRYRTGDVGCFPEGSRSGEPVFSLLSVIGREVDRIWLPDGKFIHGNQFPHLMKNHPVREFMVIQSADYRVAVQVVPDTGFQDKDRETILSTIQKNLPGLTVGIQMVDAIAKNKANKWRPVITHVERNG